MANKHTTFKSALLFPNNAITHVYSQIEQQKLIIEPVRKIIPTALAEHVLHCVVSQKKLIIFTDTATWASQLRFYNDRILAAIAPITKESVNIMQIKVTPALPAESRSLSTPIIPSAEKIKLIRSTGLMTSDEQLKQALLKLSITLQNLSDKP